MATEFYKRAFKAVGSVFIFLVLLEVLLRMGGFISLKVQEFENRRTLAAGAQFTVMCVGDSMTFLTGDRGYTDALQKTLDDRTGASKYRVLNKGLPGADSTIILKNFESWVIQYKPDMVVVMMGGNDRFEPKKLSNPWYSFLEHFQVTKLVKGIAGDINDYIQSKFVHPQVAPAPSFKAVPDQDVQLLFYALHAKASGDCETAEKIFYVLANTPDLEPTFKFRAAGEAAECFFKTKNYNALMWSLKMALEANEFDVRSVDYIRGLAQAKEAKDEVIGLLTELVQEKPNSMPLTGLLGACYAQYGDKAMADVYLNKLEAMRKQGDILILKENYIKLLKILQKYYVKGIFVQYPMRNVEVLKRMLASQKDYDNIIFVDNQASFREALRPEKYDDYFIDRTFDDLGHLTPMGNRLLAGNIADAILKYTASK